jgi:hypothetical protein
VQQAQKLAAKYAVPDVHPDEFIQAPDRPDFDDLLNQIK